MLESIRPLFRALTTTIVPGAADLDAPGWAELERIVERALAARPPALVRRLRLFILLLQWLPALRYARAFTGLDSARRTRVLSFIESAPIPLVRQGFWGLRTLVLLGYYGRAAAAAEIGYRAHPQGWEARE